MVIDDIDKQRVLMQRDYIMWTWSRLAELLVPLRHLNTKLDNSVSILDKAFVHLAEDIPRSLVILEQGIVSPEKIYHKYGTLIGDLFLYLRTVYYELRDDTSQNARDRIMLIEELFRHARLLYRLMQSVTEVDA